MIFGLIGLIFILSSCQTPPLKNSQNLGPYQKLSGKDLLPYDFSNFYSAQSPSANPIEFPTKSETQGISSSSMEKLSEALKNSEMGPYTGLVIWDTKKKENVLSFGAEKAFMPSSISKLFTAYAALEILGPEYRFTTKLSYTGKIQRGVLKGDLYLVGGGDPLLTISDLMALAYALKTFKIQKIEGNYYFDESKFYPMPNLDPVGDQDQNFNPGLSALSLEFNQIFFDLFSRGQKNQHNQHNQNSENIEQFYFTSTPPLPYLESFPHTEQKIIPGRMKLPVSQVGIYSAYAFSYLCSLLGIDLPAAQSKSLPKIYHTLKAHKSLPVIDLVEKNLEFSNNLMAELLVQASSQKLEPHNKKLKFHALAVKRIESWLKKNLKLSKQFQFQNGSGLGPYNLATANDFLQLLKKTKNKNYQGKPFFTLLPISGQKGTLREKFITPPLAWRVWAKTGTQSFAHSLAGKFYSLTGHEYLFALISTFWPKREIYDHNSTTLVQDSSLSEEKKEEIKIETQNLKNDSNEWRLLWQQWTEHLLQTLLL